MFGLERLWLWGYDWVYWMAMRVVVGFLWVRYYGRQAFTEQRIEHHEGEIFSIKVSRVRLLNGADGGDVVGWEEREGEKVMRSLEEKGDLMWDEVLGGYGEKDGEGDREGGGGGEVLLVDFVIDSDRFKMFYSRDARWEFPISFPPYSDDELEREWKSKDYKHTVLVAEVDGEDITDEMNMFLGPMGNMFKGRTCAYRAKWFSSVIKGGSGAGSGGEGGAGSGEGIVTIIDNEGQDYKFEGSEPVVFA